jgi:hypothetical protein
LPKRRDKNIVKQVAKNYIKKKFVMTEALRPFNKHLTKDGLWVKASRWKTCKQMKEAIEELLGGFKEKDIKLDEILGQLYRVAFGSDKEYKGSDRIRALELLGKYKSAFKDEKIQNIVINQDTQALEGRLSSIYHKHIQDKELKNG